MINKYHLHIIISTGSLRDSGIRKLIDWLASKIGVLIAIGVLTTFALGLFAWQHSAIVDGEGQMIADNISDTLDGIGGLDAATIINISFGNDAGQLPLTIDGQKYSINITVDMVILRSGDDVWVSKFLLPAIPSNITVREFNLTEYQSLEHATNSGEHESGQCFFIERARIDVSGEEKYLSLVYWN